MRNDFLAPDNPHEYVKAYQVYVEKIKSAGMALATHGMESAYFAETDKRAGEAYKTLRALQGYKGQQKRALE
jgi:hypothetical protein